MIGARIARLVTLIGAVFTLSACNQVLSGQPIFTEADQAKAQTLEPGLWVSRDCTDEMVRQRAPVCAFKYEVAPATLHFLVDRQALKTLQAGSDPAASQAADQVDPNEPIAYLLSAGDPPILQLGPLSTANPIYAYYGFKPVALGADGRVVEADFWTVLCGPPAAPKSSAELARANANDPWYTPPPTDAPFPGIKIDGGGCHAEDRATVVNAARASLDIESKVMPGRQPGGLRVRWIAAKAP